MIDALPPGAIGSAVTEIKASTPGKTCKAGLGDVCDIVRFVRLRCTRER
jgi:hypothetical protein